MGIARQRICFIKQFKMNLFFDTPFSFLNELVARCEDKIGKTVPSLLSMTLALRPRAILKTSGTVFRNMEITPLSESLNRLHITIRDVFPRTILRFL